MNKNILVYIKELNKPIFTTRELMAYSGKSSSTIVQCLNRLEQKGLLIKIYRGVWANAEPHNLSALNSISHLFSHQRVYVSFISALYLHGIIEQIPQVTTLASTSHTNTIHTKLGSFSLHQISSDFFNGFEWYKGSGEFLIAEPEKALIDSLYLSSRRKKQYSYFPELYFPKEFDFKKAREWGNRIPEEKIRKCVIKKLNMLAHTR